MKLVSFSVGEHHSYGVVDGDRVRDCGAVLGSALPDLRAVLVAGALARLRDAAANAPVVPLASLRFLPVIENPEKIFCVGLNYELHRRETGRSEVANPTIFTRFADSQTGHETAILLPRVSDRLDYEGELVVIIGAGGRYISPADAMAHVAGYSIYNEGSVRDYQAHTHQYTPGKNFPRTGAFGPWMVTADAFTPGDQRICTRLNGTVMQDALLSQMIFDVPTIIAYCSTFTKLSPGDVIVTGTPGGVGAKREPPVWMKAGDQVEIEIEGIGVLRNTIERDA